MKEEKNLEQLMESTEKVQEIQTEFDENNSFLKASLEAENVQVFISLEDMYGNI